MNLHANDIKTTAGSLIRAGFSVIPIKTDGSKEPTTTWKEFQTRLMTSEEIAESFTGRCGIAVVAGEASGNLEIIDIEGRANVGELLDLIEECIPGLLSKLPRVKTPSGGLHLYYRCPVIQRSQKLARRADANGSPEVLIETRGQGAYVLAPGSPPACHPLHKTYDLVHGLIRDTPTITPEDRDIVLNCCRSFNTYVARERYESAKQENNYAPRGGRPGDEYGAQADIPALLERHGWTPVKKAGSEIHYRRPGKDHGISAVWNHCNYRLLWVFSSNGHPFEPDRGYNPFAVYAHLEHGGDFSAAARQLASEGYGDSTPAGPQQAQGRTESAEPRERPRIDAKIGDLREASAAAAEALVLANEPPRLFTFGGKPARIEDEGDGPRPVVMGEYELRHELARAADYFRPNARSKNVSRVAPPMEVVRDLRASPNSPFPVLRGVVRVPMLKLDGKVLEPGYDAKSGLFLDAGDLTFPAFDRPPTTAEISAAIALIRDELLGDFPFASEADRAHAIGLLLLPMARELIDGATPLHLIEKPSPGTGATLLADIASLVATGHHLGALIEGREDAEWRKQLTTKLLGSPAAILIDNLRRPLDSAALASAITSPYWGDRLLSTNTELRLPVRCAWIATGNNPTLSNEIARRSVRIRLDAKVDQPWLRDKSKFRHADLRGWVLANRERLVTALLTLLRAWWYAGRPEPSHGRRLGMFENWSHVIGGALEVADIDGFLGNLDEFYGTADIKTATTRAFLREWLQRFGEAAVGSVDLFPLALRSELELGDKNEHSQKTKLGKILGGMRDVSYALGEGVDIVFERVADKQGAAQFRLRKVTS